MVTTNNKARIRRSSQITRSQPFVDAPLSERMGKHQPLNAHPYRVWHVNRGALSAQYADTVTGPTSDLRGRTRPRPALNLPEAFKVAQLRRSRS